MSPYRFSSLLAFATTVLAVPNANGHGYAHQHLHGARSAPPPPAYGYGDSSSSAAAWSTSSAAPWSSQAPYWPVSNSTTSSVMGTAGSSSMNGMPTSMNGLPTSTVVSTNTNTVHSTSTVTIHYAPSSSSAQVSAAAISNGANGGEQCGQDVTVTSTEKVYVTVTAGEGSPSSNAGAWSSSSAPVWSAPASSSEAAPVLSSSSAWSAPSSSSEAPVKPSAPAYSAPSTSEAAPVSSSAAPKWSAPASSQSAPAYGGDDKEATGAAAQPSSSAPAPSSYSSGSSSGSSGSGKRGLAYNQASMCDSFGGSSQVSWAYNWGSSSNGLTGSWKYMPTLWSTTSDFTNDWSTNAQAAVSAGAPALFSFNEPDISSQANLSPSAAAQGYMQYMQPFAGKGSKLCAPSVSNSATTGQGLSWLSEFMTACSSCTIDCINVHWYADASATQNFKDHITQAASTAPGKPIYVTEIGATGSSDEINSFLQDVMPWMDSNDDVAGYAYYMVQDGLLMTGDSPSTYGSTYKSYVGSS